MGAGLLVAIMPPPGYDWKTDKAIKANQKAYTFIYARLHDEVISELSPETSDPSLPDAKCLWKELRAKYGGGEMHELVSTIVVVLGIRIDDNVDPRDKLNDMRSAYLKLNENSVPLDDKFFALLLLRALPESYSATVQVLFSQPNLTSAKVITAARNYWELKANKEDNTSAALTARKNFDKNTHRDNPNSIVRFHGIYHPHANSHDTAECRTARHMAQVSNKPNNNARPRSGATANIATSSDIMSYATAYIATTDAGLRSTEFHLDSGASEHLTCDEALLFSPVPYRSAVTIGDGTKLYSTHRGTMRINDTLKVKNALFVPELTCNLLSVRQFLLEGMDVRFSRDVAIITDKSTRAVVGTAPYERQNGSYTLRPSPPISQALLATSTDYVLNWHYRLGHLHFGEVVRLGKAGLLDKDWDSKCTYANMTSNEHICEPCILGTGSRMPSLRIHDRSTKPNQLVHIDLWIISSRYSQG